MNRTPDNASDLRAPGALAVRIRQFVTRRLAIELAASLALAVGVAGFLLLLILVLDQLVLLPAAVRYVLDALVLLPPAAWLAAVPWWWARSRADARDLRRLDNRDDDLRATLNLVERLQAGDQGLQPDLVGETVARAAQFERLPLPTLDAERRRFWRAAGLAATALVGLAAWRGLSPDMHTGLNRLLHPAGDYGSIGSRKFPVAAEVWANPAVLPPGGAEAAAVVAAKRADVYFLKERWENGTWKANFSAAPRSLADWLAGPDPLESVNREVTLLQGDRLDLAFGAMDGRSTPAIEGVEFIRFEGDRELQLRYQVVEKTGKVSVGQVARDHTFMLRSGAQFSPRYQVRVVPRPTPTQIYLFQKPPAQYGRGERELVIRHTEKNVNQNRLGGLPGSRLTVEFETPYGEDLDVRESFVQIGETRRLKLKRITSRNPERRARGEKMWTFDFVIDESFAAGTKLYFHLVTAQARFAGQPIANAYDEPFLVQSLDDFPPMVEITSLPQRRHFASDEAFAFRYRYTDDFGVSEVGLELRSNPRAPEATYVPVGVRPPAVAGEVRREDELLQILDLSEYPYGFVDFAVVVKDIKGQVVKSSVVSLTMSDSPTDSLLPRLTGGWRWAWDHNRQNAMFAPGDLETPPAAKAFDPFREALSGLQQFAAGTPLKAEALTAIAKALDYRHHPFVSDGMPFGFHNRDYPYFFHRQASTWLAGLATFDGRTLTGVRDLVTRLAAAPDPLKAPEFAQLQARRDELAELRERLDLMADTKLEISRRVALQRAAYFCALIVRRVADTERLMATLQQAAGPMPSAQQVGDPWEIYPDWVTRNKSDPEIQQQARMAAFSVRNVNRRMAALNVELTRLLEGSREGLDSRLVAVMSMLARSGKTVFGANRTELTAKATLLVRFINQGVLAAESEVYRDIAGEFPACVAQAQNGQGQIAGAAKFMPAFLAFSDALATLADADLRRRMGEPVFPAGKSERWTSNQTSRMRSLLDGLMEQSRRIQRGADFAECANLPAISAALLELRETLGGIREGLPNWPVLVPQRGLLDAVDTAAANLLAAVAAVAETQRTAGILGGFQGMFEKDGLPEVTDRGFIAATGACLAELATFEQLAPGARAALDPIIKAKASKPLAPAEVQAACDAEAARLARVRQLLEDAGARFQKLAALPVWGGARDRVPATQPLVGISAASSRLFEAMSPVAVLTRLDADVRKAAADPARVDALFDAATGYFCNLPIDSAKDPLGNPVEEYLRARAAAAFYTCSPAAIVPFVETFTHSANERKNWLRDYFKGRAFPEEAETFLKEKDYGVPALPPDLAPLAKPWLDMGAALTPGLKAQRLQRLQELLALARSAQAIQQQHEALIRVHDLISGLTDLKESVGLMRYPIDDIRIENLWADIAEQAEGLERDLLANRLPDVPVAHRQALRQCVHVFRRASYAEVLKDAGLFRLIREYEATLRALEALLMPRALEAQSQLKADLPNLRRDVALVLLTMFNHEYWFERQLELEAIQKRVLLSAPGSEEERKRNMPPVGSMALGREIQNVASLAAYAWRAQCDIAVMEYAGEPADAPQEALLHDYAWLSVLKLLPEFIYQEFESAAGWRLYGSRFSADGAMVQMCKQLQMLRRTEAFVIRALAATKPMSGLPSRNLEILEWVMPFEATSVLNQNEKDFLDYQKSYRVLVKGSDLQAVKDSAGRIRSLRQAQGQFWRLYGDGLVDALDAGRPLLELEAGAKLAPAELQRCLKAQREAFRSAIRYMELMGAGLSEKEQADMTVVADAAAYDDRWLEALAAPGGAAAAEYAAGYRELHESVQSFVQSLQGNIFPPEPIFPPRPMWRQNMPHLGAFARDAEMVGTENRWFARADNARALLYREFCNHARARLAGETPDPRVIAFAFQRYQDTRYRHQMPFATKEPGSGRPPPRSQLVDPSMPEHLNQAFANAQTIDLPEQDNKLVRKLYFEALQTEKDNTRSGD